MTRPDPQREPESATIEAEGDDVVRGAQRDLRIRGETRSVHLDDVDEVIGIAAEMKQQASERLTTDDLEDIGRQLDIEPAFIRKAVDALLARQAEQRAREAEHAKSAQLEAERRKRTATRVAIVLGSLLLVMVAALYGAQSSLSEARAVVDQKAAQVDNVIERQRAVKARYESAPPGPERDAMLDGAENRVRIERRRYDEAVSRYNAEAAGPLASMARSVFALPARLPLSNEVERW